MRPVTVEIVAYAPTEFFHCMHCEFVWRASGVGPRIHAEQRAAALPPNLAEEYARLGAWACDLQQRFGDHVRIEVTDAVSLQGFFTLLRHRAWRIPTIIVDGRSYAAHDLDALTAAIERELPPVENRNLT